MSMLDEQIKELREAARNIQGNLGRCLYRRKDVDEMQQVSCMLMEAAGTIEQLQAVINKATGNWARADAELREQDGSRWHELFGTPERAARTLARMDVDACNWCVNSSGNPEDCKSCPYEYDYYGCYLPEKFSMLEWLRGDAE